MKTIKYILIGSGVIVLLWNLIYYGGMLAIIIGNQKYGIDINFTNHSQDTICVLPLGNYLDKKVPWDMPFTIDKNNNDSTKLCVHGINLIPPDSTAILGPHRLHYRWEKEAETSQDHKIHFVVFKTSTILNNSWRDIKMKNIYDRCYTLSLDSLEKMNWTITYP